MSETLRQVHNRVVDEVRSILGISLINLIRGTLSVEADALNRLELTLSVRPEWCDNPLIKEYLEPKLKTVSDCRNVSVSKPQLDGSCCIQLQFTVPLDPTSTIG